MRRALLASVLLWPIVSAAAENQTVCVVAIHEEITHNTLFLVRRALREASGKKAAALILDMDTNGGRVDATEEIIRVLEGAPMKTYTYVDRKAFSAGAFIACATDKIYMSPGSVIGAATPVVIVPGSGIQELPKSYQEKMTSAMRALIRATAQQKGHNPDVFEAMVDPDKEVVIDSTTINPKGKLLTLTSDEASRAYGNPPKPLLSAGTANSLEDLLASLKFGGATVERVEPYGFEVAARWITVLSPLLIMVGLVAIYLELKAPGLGVPTVVALVCFGLYFIGFFIAGLAGWEQPALFVLGIALLGVEILFPGHLMSGVAGVCLIIIALILAMTEKFPGGPILPAWSQLEIPLLKVLGAFICSVVVMMILGRYLPQSTLFRRMELAAATSAAAGYTTASGEATALLGETGVAETNLRPSGKGRFGDQLVDVVTEGDLIQRGVAIKITKVHGARVVVERVAT